MIDHKTQKSIPSKTLIRKNELRNVLLKVKGEEDMEEFGQTGRDNSKQRMPVEQFGDTVGGVTKKYQCHYGVGSLYGNQTSKCYCMTPENVFQLGGRQLMPMPELKVVDKRQTIDLHPHQAGAPGRPKDDPAWNIQTSCNHGGNKEGQN